MISSIPMRLKLTQDVSRFDKKSLKIHKGSTQDVKL